MNEKNSEFSPMPSQVPISSVVANLLVVGVVKDSQKNLKTNVEELRKALQGVSLRWMIIESNSSDKTLQILKELAMKHKGFDFRSLGKDPSRRLQAIARARQSALLEAKAMRPKPTHVLNIDLDQRYDWCNASLSISAQKADGVFAHQNPYYDLFAFEAKGEIASGGFPKYRDRRSFLGRVWNYFFIAPIWQLRLGKVGSPIEVMSAFGGAGLYSYELYVSGNYLEGLSDSVACEHKVFHESLKERGPTLWIDPAFHLPVRNSHANVAKAVLPVFRLASGKQKENR